MLRNVRPSELPLTQEQLADAVGLTSDHVNRTLMRLEKQGHIRILNVGRRDASTAIAHLLCEFALRMEIAELADPVKYVAARERPAG